MEDDTTRIYDDITASYDKWVNIPEGCHLLCPKVSDDDEEDYTSPGPPISGITAQEKEQRIRDGQYRKQVTYDLCLMLGISKEAVGDWLYHWIGRIEFFLMRCDACILSYHMYWKIFQKKLRESFDDDVVIIMQNRINEFNYTRIDRGLEKACEILDANGPMNSAKLAELDLHAVLALFEALCCMPYIAEPERRKRYFNRVFQDVQTRKPLRLGSPVIPTMTFFLFEEDQYRNKFARAAWEGLQPESLTAEQFEWAVNEFLAFAIQDVSLTDPSGALVVPMAKVKLFWEGFLLLLNSMSEEIVLHCLRGMEIQTDVYHLIILHLQNCSSDEVLLLLLEAVSALIKKSSKAFWGALQDLPRAQLAQFVFMNPSFDELLGRSLEYDRLVDDGALRVPFLAVWVKTVLEGLQEHELPDVCQSLTDHLLGSRPGTITNREMQTTRTIAGLYALQTALKTFNSTTAIRLGTSVTYINMIINLVVKFTAQVINPAAELRVEDRYNVGLSQTALNVIKTSLLLDSKTTRAEWITLTRGTSKIPRTIQRHSDKLWEGFLDVFWPGRPGSTDMAKSMLVAMHPLSGIGRFAPPKREQLSDEKKLFNSEIEKTSEAVGRMMERLTGFTITDLEALCSEQQSGLMYAIVASLVHSEDAIRESGISLIKAITGEGSRSDAVAQMVAEYFHSFLSTFSDIVRSVTYDKDSMNAYAPMPHVLNSSQDLVAALCDTSGLLRSRRLSGIEHAAVTSWWTTQWESLQHSFSNLRQWSQEMEKSILEVFCRKTMELAQSLLAQDGVVASALQAERSEKDAMKMVLEQPRSHTTGMADMLKLRDPYLLDITVQTLVKLLNRLAEYDLEVEDRTGHAIRNSCIPKADGRYAILTNLSASQRAELLKAFGEDEDDVQVVKVVEKDKPKKQSSLDAWSKSGATTSLSRSGSTTPVSGTRDVKATTTSKLAGLRLGADKPKAKLLRPEPNRLDANKFIEERKRAKAEKAQRDAAAVAKARASRLVPGEGSGLKAISGIQGKDHTPQQKSDMMVDSSEEEDDSSDDDNLVSGKTKLDHDARKRALELAAKTMGPLKKEKLKRSAKDMRARLIPPMEVLHQAILEWDIFHDGNDPPNGAACVEVANTYVAHYSYKSTFFPLLLYEAWRSFVTAKDETTAKPFGIKVQNRMTVDKFLEVTTLMPANQNKERIVGEGDIVIISKSDDPLHQQSEPHCLARIWKTTYKRDNLEVAYRLSSRNNQLMSVLQPGQSFHAVRITNMTTIEREYAALESLQYYDLLDEIMEAKPSPLLNYGEEAIERVQKNYSLNPGQAKAIMNAKDNDGFTLIQGPPGTGKTKTIVAMVGALLTGTVGQKPAVAVPVSRPHLPGFQPTQPAPMKKLLVCAPSNAAVDELVLRLKQGVTTMNGAFHRINVLRLGRSDAINAAVKDVTLDELVKAMMDSESSKNGTGGSERDKLHQEAGEIKVQLNDLRPRLEASRANEDRALTNDLQRQFDILKRRQAQIGAKIDADKDSGNTYVREVEIKRRQVQQKILDNAQVLCATLSGSGHEMFKNLNVEFETVIIDEAAQCVELSALIPLKYGCTKCILVGDPKQLPPTVLSQSAARFGYDQSLFVRMQRNHPQHVHLLDTQYRMHPEISAFPSTEFYEGKLYDGDDMGRLRVQPWHASTLLGPYRFFDVEGIQERGRRGQSLVNTNELDVAMQLYHRFRQDYPDTDLMGKVGIITPYKAQLHALRERFANRWGESIFEQIEFNTTDAFQGRECEIIIFSCVRASPTGGIGFMTDIRRMNVGLTRAKSSLWILGDSRALRQGEFWNKLIKDSQARQRYTNGDVLALLRKPTERTSSVAPIVGYGNIKPSDVDMENAPPLQPRSLPHGKSRNAAPPPQSHGGFNEKGEVTSARVRGMLPPEIGESKKRPLEGADSSSSAAKRQVPSSAGSNRGMPGGPVPTGPRATGPPSGPRQRPPPPTPRAIDPSAMEVLGLAPPSRPPPLYDPLQLPPVPPQHSNRAPRHHQPQRPGGPSNAGPSGEQQPPRNNRKKRRNGADPFIPKKNKRVSD